jgi:hypothetical protein
MIVMVIIGLLFACFKNRMAPIDILIIISLIMIFVIKSIHTGILVSAMIFTYYYGWLIAYYYIKIGGVKVNMNHLLSLFCWCVIIEAILINTIVPASILPNYPDINDAPGHFNKFFGFYQRPYSIGNNSSISSTILCLLLFFIESLHKKHLLPKNSLKLELLAFITLLSFASGVGFFLYMLYVTYKLNMLKIKNLLFFAVFVAGIVYTSIYMTETWDTNNRNIFTKISSTYIQTLIKFKSKQFDETFDSLQKSSLAIGNISTKGNIPLGSDFALLNLFYCLGISGITMFFIFVFLKSNSINLIVVMIGIIGLFHYGGIFSLAGQLVFAYSLNIKRNNILKYI